MCENSKTGGCQTDGARRAEITSDPQKKDSRFCSVNIISYQPLN